ncbi:TonB-dependent receptor [Rasiella rasia]|uniref:TonB-dependent receptor n=1 Tax=Rasiella rasia TaxID=2744027 RepID=A0A6G6GI34_9FLAO|nr:TonB-dependent receptor [Rasiella rasia]QIE58208.1 TonB-dependent receptor [Rasiella rasia]
MKQRHLFKQPLFFFLMFLSIFGFAQQEPKTISVTFYETPLEIALETIATKAGYQAYYVIDWLDTATVTGSFTNSTVNEVLETILNKTVLNFYITRDNKLILTKNNRIYDELPKNFFEEVPTETTTQAKPTEIVKSPVFYNQPQTIATKLLETVRIGKEDKNNAKTSFVLKGTARNQETGKLVSNIAITVEGTTLGAITSEKGAFKLQLPGGVYILSAQSLGFQTLRKRVVLYNDGTLDLTLSEALEGLDEVIVTGKVKNVVASTDMGTTEVDVEQIKNIPLVLGERDVFKAAATLPGISSAGEGAAGYNVRGGSSDQNLILLDDGVLYNPAHFFGIFSAVNPFTTQDLTIYKGHIPARFGGRLSSVFDITTRNANVNEFEGEASIGPVTSSVVIETPLAKEKAAIMVGARGTYSDIILKNLDEEELRNSQANFYDVILKYNHKLNDKNSLQATGYYSRDAFSITSDSLYRYSNRLITLHWNHTINEKHKGTMVLSNSNYQFNVDFEGQTNTNFELGYGINETELKLKMNYELNKQHTFQYGLSSKLYAVRPGDINPLGDSSIIVPISIDKERALESALYVSDNFEINKKLAVEGGIRLSVFTALGEASQNIYAEGASNTANNLIETRNYGSFETIKTYLAPEFRIASRYLFTPKFSVKGSINTHYQYIHKLSNNTTASPIDTWKLSDLNIEPERTVQYALGLFHNFSENIYELSIEGYYKRSSNVLDYKVGAQLLLNEAVEQEVLQGEGKAYGVELLLKKLKGKLNGWVGYTYSRSFLKLDGNSPEEQVNNGAFFRSNYDKPHDFSLVANYKISKRFSFSGNFVYQTGRPVTVPIGNFVVNNTELVLFSDRNAFRIPDYYRLDLGFNVEGNHKKNKLAHSFWNISVYNVLGRNNPYSVFFVAKDGDVKAYRTSIFSVAIPTISYNIKF